MLLKPEARYGPPTLTESQINATSKLTSNEESNPKTATVSDLTYSIGVIH